MKSKLNQNIGISVSIAVVNTVQIEKKVFEWKNRNTKWNNGKSNWKLYKS